ncbi:predicted protein [Sclerotinia sclerotiorum 1980 UF-70]|uniref:Uncharacterized protein n=1 Tax=Sclerotinia sclerotiorum (strain ATCC 18683 / 1980 / Ss-1) TaxID=665079 RepID=A7E972_SCLS1|nr:predicted protein [Sclerotinia sclerotiorum 1980 UF-70]EDN96924.1 predicted protein [Sclerotinia sclerotiorum 1980 UF-70]
MSGINGSSSFVACKGTTSRFCFLGIYTEESRSTFSRSSSCRSQSKFKQHAASKRRQRTQGKMNEEITYRK